MENYERTRVLSVRLATADLEALAEQAKAEGRSVSGQVAFLVREKVATWQSPKRKPRKISGWLAHLDVPDSHGEFRTKRRKAGAKLLAAARKKAERAASK